MRGLRFVLGTQRESDTSHETSPALSVSAWKYRTLRDCPPYLSFLRAPKPLACDANQKQPARRKKCPAAQLLRLIIAQGAFSAAADGVSSHFLLVFK